MPRTGGSKSAAPPSAAMPRNVQVYELLRARIDGGLLAPGDRLPPTRDLSRELAVSRNTVLAAYEMLAAEGYTRARRGGGTRVAEQLPDPAAPRRARRDRAAAPRLS